MKIKVKSKFKTNSLDFTITSVFEILKSVLSHEKITIERGVMDFVELYSELGLKEYKNEKQIKKELDDLIFSNVHSFKENKKLANLFILGINNFVCNKETIYDKYFDNSNEIFFKFIASQFLDGIIVGFLYYRSEYGAGDLFGFLFVCLWLTVVINGVVYGFRTGSQQITIGSEDYIFRLR